MRPEYREKGDELQQLGMQVSDIREILVTQNHPDHIGLAERLVQETGARLLLHQLDAASEQAEPEERQSMLAEMEHWLHTNGMPQEEWETIMRGIRRMPFRIPRYHPATLLEGGEGLDWSPFRFEEFC